MRRLAGLRTVGKLRCCGNSFARIARTLAQRSSGDFDEEQGMGAIADQSVEEAMDGKTVRRSRAFR